MTTTQIVHHRQSAARAVELQDVHQRAARFIAASTAASTAKAYRSDWRHFVAWCHDHHLEHLPAAPETVAHYLAALSETHKPATLAPRAASISVNHQAVGYEPPTRTAVVQSVLKGIRRTTGTASTVKAPLTVEDLRVIARDYLPDGVKGIRDRALLLLGFAGAFRRSELVGIDREHLEFVPEGVVVTLPRSKTDQEGAGRKVAIPYGQHPDTCAVSALAAWLAAAHISSGPVFRRVDRHGNIGADRLTGKSIAVTVKNYVRPSTKTRLPMPVTACAPGSPRPRPAPARRNATSCGRPDTAPRSWSGATYATAVCSAATRRRWLACSTGHRRGPLPSRVAGLSGGWRPGPGDRRGDGSSVRLASSGPDDGIEATAAHRIGPR